MRVVALTTLFCCAATGFAEEENGEKEEVFEIQGKAPEVAPITVTVHATEAASVAGAGGDALRAVTSLPGVARAGAGSSELVIWGSAPAETRILIDGVPLPALYHIGGHRSVLPTAWVGGIHLVPGAYGAEYGRSVGGMVSVQTRELPDEGTHGEVSADLFDTSATVSSRLGSNTRTGIGVRYGYLKHIASGVVDDDARELVPLPQYYDGQAKVTVEIGPGQSLDFVVLGSGDVSDRQVSAADPTEVRSERDQLHFLSAYAKYNFSGGQADSTVTPFVTMVHRREQARFGERSSKLSTDTLGAGLNASFSQQLSPHVTLILGFDGLTERSRHDRLGTLGLPPREGDIILFGQAPPEDVSADRWSAWAIDAAGYASVELRRGGFGLTPGFRLATVVTSSSRALPTNGMVPPVGTSQLLLCPEPRLSATWEPGERLGLRIDAGLYHQAPETADLSATFGTPTLGPLRAVHVATSVRTRLWHGSSLQLIGFGKALWDVPARSAADSPQIAHALESNGLGRGFGGELLLRQAPWHGLSGWLAYTLSRSERKRSNEPVYRPLDFDQTHVVSAVLSYDLGGWTFGTRARYATGSPRTEVLGGAYDVKSDLYQPMFGRPGAIRLPAFMSVDVRAERRFSMNPLALRVFVDVQNVSNRKNAEEFVYDHDFSEREHLTGLPTLAIVGAALSF